MHAGTPAKRIPHPTLVNETLYLRPLYIREMLHQFMRKLSELKQLVAL